MSAQVSFTPPPIQPALPLVCSKLASGPRAVAAHTRDWSSESFVQHSPGDAGGFAPNAWQAHALYYYRARQYDATTGRFTSIDPMSLLLRDRKEINGYSYVSGNPIAFTDPEGLNIYGNYCGPGGTGAIKDDLDFICFHHDQCYLGFDVTWKDRTFGTNEPLKINCIRDCDRDLCDRLRQYTPLNDSQRTGKKRIMWFFKCRP